MTKEGLITKQALAQSTLVGRHPSCQITIDHPNVPLYWLEIRWVNKQWAWRPLTPQSDTTRGTGRSLGKGWRILTKGRVRCIDEVSIELTDEAPPDVFATDLQTGATVMGEALGQLVEVWRDRVLLRNWESTDGSLMKNHSIKVIDGSVYRFHIPTRFESTSSTLLAVHSDDCAVDVHWESLTAVFTVQLNECRVTGECVRVLWAYCQARLEDQITEGGWLSREEAFHAWVGLGGLAGSPSERIGWEKGKLRTRMASAGAVGLQFLFENRQQGGQRLSRIALKPAQISLIGR